MHRIILRSGWIHQTRDNILIQNKLNNNDDYTIDQKLTGMIDHAPSK